MRLWWLCIAAPATTIHAKIVLRILGSFLGSVDVA